MDKIVVKGARENNLKNIDIELPKNKLIVMTGVSGSGKSSLAFDTIYAEGQRRYVESLSAYARQFLGGTDKPDVDSIDGLSPSISIDQKTTNKNPRSTVGTITEIYDYLRLLFARIGVPHCPTHKIPIQHQSVEEMTNKVLDIEDGTKIEILAPVVHGEKGTHADLFDELRKQGYSRVRVNGENRSLDEEIILEKNIKDNIQVIIDRLVVKEDVRSRLFEAIEASTTLADGKVVINVIGGEEIVMSEKYACPLCNFSLPELEPRMFSFNSPYGACPDCKGLGVRQSISEDLVVTNPNKSIAKGGLASINETSGMNYTQLETVAKHYKIDLKKPIKDLTRKEKDIIFYGTDKVMKFTYESKSGNVSYRNDTWEGVIKNLERRYIETSSAWIRDWLDSYMIESPCPTCHGARLQDSILAVTINKKNIYNMTLMSIKDASTFLGKLKLNKEQEEISGLLLKEINSRLDFLLNVGLGYLSLSRSAATLSGGEAQRIRLATQIGSKLSGVLYVLDEPSIGLHQADNEKLIHSLKEMRDLGNTLVVVEHDVDTMLASDYLVDIGPGAGTEGGYVVAEGTPEEVMKNKKSITGQYLSGKLKIDVLTKRRKGNGKNLEIKGASENNLKNIDVKFPLGKLICVTGVSGSGKSSLVNEILHKSVASNLYNTKYVPGKFKKINGLNNIDKVVMISQDAIGRTPRSNPATYTGVFDDIRDLFALTPEAKLRGYDKGRFSFNVKGGRCERCQGDGVKRISMHFLPDVYVPCEECGGTRYNEETLQVTYKGKNIYDILEMTVEDGVEFFQAIPKVHHRLKTLVDVGLGYIKLGQPAPTLSGGEAQRVKLASELQRKPTGKTLFVLDEPTTGLHSNDVKRLLSVLQRIADNGDTVLVIEHNLDIIKCSDYIIDLGPEGGDGGGTIVATGTPEAVSKVKESYTGYYLKKALEW